jgi:ABC-type bacteriocin/lantibiotic exporter with double-glycine peptidase domain
MYYKYPFTKQDGLKNCACACMQMIIKYYNGYISLEDLSNYLNTDKTGTSALKIIEVFKNLGFSSEGIKTSLTEINKDNLILPAIAHVTVDKSYNHYIIVYKINFKKKYLLIADPNSKIKKISYEEFNKYGIMY